MDQAALGRLTTAINRDLRNCGCVYAAVACVAALVTSPWVLPMMGWWWSDGWLVPVAVGFAYAALAAAAGKLAGLVLIERRLARNVRKLSHLM